jgi:hypothetical protein
VIAWAERAKERLGLLDTSDEQLEEMEAERGRLAGEVAELASALSASRKTAAGRFGEQVTVELAGLAMPHARIEVVVAPRPGRREPSVADGGRGRGGRRGPTARTRSRSGFTRTRGRPRRRCRKAPPAASCPG